MKLQVILVAAGSGMRLKVSKPKPLVLLKGKPLIEHSLKVFQASRPVHSIVLVVHSDLIDVFTKLVEKRNFKKVGMIVAGGATRSDSVQHGLSCIDDDTDVVMVHDAARPFVTEDMIKRSLQALVKDKAAIVAVPAKSTIKKVDPKNLYVLETLPRDTLWEVQTPQTFRKDILVKAHASQLCCDPTDDAMLVEKMGIKVKVVMGDYRNIKVTIVEDLAIAEALLRGTKDDGRWTKKTSSFVPRLSSIGKGTRG